MWLCYHLGLDLSESSTGQGGTLVSAHCISPSLVSLLWCDSMAMAPGSSCWRSTLIPNFEVLVLDSDEAGWQLEWLTPILLPSPPLWFHSQVFLLGFFTVPFMLLPDPPLFLPWIFEKVNFLFWDNCRLPCSCRKYTEVHVHPTQFLPKGNILQKTLSPPLPPPASPHKDTLAAVWRQSRKKELGGFCSWTGICTRRQGEGRMHGAHSGTEMEVVLNPHDSHRRHWCSSPARTSFTRLSQTHSLCVNQKAGKSVQH